ncbi:MAG: serine/threonine protein kinase, partial [Acidobacteria bacterium ACB2]|nr:serine/threonine protein kinase [Acidobacteria bacterium ACB2]
MEIGEQVGKYVVEAELGRGGMGVVYRARHATLERTVALKVLSPKLAPDSSARGRFVREAQAIARLNHPGIVQIFDIEEQGELLYLVMEFVEGDNLDGLLKKTSISFKRAARIVADLAAALHFAHEKGVVHRDVKPANILLTPHRTVKLADFGLAHLLDREMGLTKTGMVVGSPHYMSPEQCQGNPVDRRADVYALGIVLYRMLVGSVPFSAPNSLSVLVSQVQEPTPDPLAKNPQVPVPLRDVIVRAMEKDPNARFQTMREMQRALLAWLGEPLPDDREEFLKQKSVDVPTVLLPGVPPGAGSGPGARAATATEAIPAGALPTALSS